MQKTGYAMLVCWLLAHLSVTGQTAYQEAVSQGLRFQMRADSLQRVVDAQVAALAVAPESQKNGIKIAIKDNNAQAIAMQNKANEWFTQAGGNGGIAVTEPTGDDESAEPDLEPIVKKASENVAVAPMADFAILPKSPYSAGNPIPIDLPLPDGVFYRIQLGAFSKSLPANAFKGLSPVMGEKLANGVTKYYVGQFRKFADADDALRKVHEYGYKDAYLVAFYNKKIINPERAKQLELSVTPVFTQ